MALITTGKLIPLVSTDNENDYIEISRHDKTTDTYESYKINVGNLLSNVQGNTSLEDTYLNYSDYGFQSDDYVDLVSEQNVTGYKKFALADITQATGGTASFSEITTKSLQVDSTALFQNNLTCYGAMYGLAMSACWADLAEYYESDYNYSPGTLVVFGGEKELTIATDKVNAVVTDNPGFILNSNNTNSCKTAIALVGRTPIRVIGKIDKFDRITISQIPGVGKKKTEENEKTIGIALELNQNNGEKLVMCATKFEF